MALAPATTGISPDIGGLNAQRSATGRVAGTVISLAALAALAAGAVVRHPSAPFSFFVLSLVALGTGVACIFVPWDRMPARCLHAIPVLATVEVAIGVRLAGVYGDIAADYYIFIVLFAAYAFSSRRAIAGYVFLDAAATGLRLFYADPHPTEALAATMVRVLVLVTVAGIVTLLREQLQQRQGELTVLATHDPLTGVGNYRLLTERLEYEIVRHRRSGAHLTVMLLDLDGFKEINDSLGHLTGDRVLREVAAALSSTLRADDTLARQGGDEFSILAAETAPAQAERLAARAQQAVHAATGGGVTTSVGWVSAPTHAEGPESLLARADANLLHAKAKRGAGRGGQPELVG